MLREQQVRSSLEQQHGKQSRSQRPRGTSRNAEARLCVAISERFR